MKAITEILKKFPFGSNKHSDRYQERVLATYFFELPASNQTKAYEAAGISQSAAYQIQKKYRKLSPVERSQLIRHLSTRYEELAEHDRGEKPE